MRGNISANCGSSTIVAPERQPPGSPRTRLSSTATSCCSNKWWTYNGYIQDGYSRGRLRLNGRLPTTGSSRGTWVAACPRTRSGQPAPGGLRAGAEQRPGYRRHRPFGDWSSRLRRFTTWSHRRDRRRTRLLLLLSTRVVIANTSGGSSTPTSLTWGPDRRAAPAPPQRERRAGTTPTWTASSRPTS